MRKNILVQILGLLACVKIVTVVPLMFWRHTAAACGYRSICVHQLGSDLLTTTIFFLLIINIVRCINKAQTVKNR